MGMLTRSVVGVFLLSLTSSSWGSSLTEFTGSAEINVEKFHKKLNGITDTAGRVTPELQKVFYEMEEKYSGTWSPAEQAEFQDLVARVGGKMKTPIQMPQNQTPFWFSKPGELHHYRSAKSLPKKADYVVIGAGLTGTSAAYHLAGLAKTQKVVILDAGHPASQSSGKNGGNFQLLSESYTGNYEGLVQERLKWIEKTRPELSAQEKSKLAEENAKTILNFSLNNFHRFRSLVNAEKIDCDFSEKGWLRIAGTAEEEAALFKDTEWLGKQKNERYPEFEIWTAKEISERTGIQTPYAGRFISKNGNYHPYKFVTEVLKRTIQKGVELYTGVKVLSVVPEGNEVRIKTQEGEILAGKVIVATNAQTPELFPQLSAIKTVPSQIINLEHVENQLKGMTLTERGGDIYYNFPRSKTYTDSRGVTRGMIHLGLDFEHPVNTYWNTPRSETLFREMKQITDSRFPDTQGQPPSRVWTGPMAFTDDRVPLIGFMESKNIVIAAAFQGYGGSYCAEAGYVASEMARTGKVHPEVPETMFSPLRFKK